MMGCREIIALNRIPKLPIFDVILTVHRR